MTNSIRKNAILMMLALGLVFTAMVPGAMAQERCRTRSRQVAYYDNNNDRYRNDNPDYRNDDRYRNNNPDYRNDNRDYRNDDRYDSRNDNRNYSLFDCY